MVLLVTSLLLISTASVLAEPFRVLQHALADNNINRRLLGLNNLNVVMISTSPKFTTNCFERTSSWKGLCEVEFPKGRYYVQSQGTSLLFENKDSETAKLLFDGIENFSTENADQCKHIVTKCEEYNNRINLEVLTKKNKPLVVFLGRDANNKMKTFSGPNSGPAHCTIERFPSPSTYGLPLKILVQEGDEGKPLIEEEKMLMTAASIEILVDEKNNLILK